MPTRTYICENFANCDLALAKESIEIEIGNDALCPSCKLPLKESSTEKIVGRLSLSGGTKYVAVAAIALIVVLTVWVLVPSSPNPAKADAMLTDFFSRIK